jgi:hypothetical protein
MVTPGFSIRMRQDSADPTSAIAAATEDGSQGRDAIADCNVGTPDPTKSTRSVSTSRGERDITHAAISSWSDASARITAGGEFSSSASASAMDCRTIGDGSSSCMISAPSAAARSSYERSE